MMYSIKSQQGFTLIELMLAMALFATIMIISTAGFIGINRTYTRGTISKQLSESTQRVTNVVSEVLRSNQQAGSFTVVDDSTDSTWRKLCVTGARFYWKNAALDSEGLFVDSKKCDDALDSDAATKLVDRRYKTEYIDVSQIAGNRGLYEISGVIRTNDDVAFTTQVGNQDLDPSYDPDALRCKGSSAGSVVRTCAVERFRTVVNTKGATL